MPTTMQTDLPEACVKPRLFWGFHLTRCVAGSSGWSYTLKIENKLCGRKSIKGIDFTVALCYNGSTIKEKENNNGKAR